MKLDDVKNVVNKVDSAVGKAEDAVSFANNLVQEGVRWFANWLLELPPARQLEMNLGFQAMQKAAIDRYKMPIPVMKGFYIPNVKGTIAGVMDQILLEMMQEWMKPNLGGIIINATTEKQSRQVDISENMIIIQSTDMKSGKEYNTDNSVPYPRTWQVEGYLAANAPWVDEHFILRPTLVWQQMMLDAYATSRKPILYKSGLAPSVVPVLIESYEIGRTVEGTNGYSISITLREFVTYTVPMYNPGGSEEDFLNEATTGKVMARGASNPNSNAVVIGRG